MSFDWKVKVISFPPPWMFCHLTGGPSLKKMENKSVMYHGVTAGRERITTWPRTLLQKKKKSVFIWIRAGTQWFSLLLLPSLSVQIRDHQLCIKRSPSSSHLISHVSLFFFFTSQSRQHCLTFFETNTITNWNNVFSKISCVPAAVGWRISLGSSCTVNRHLSQSKLNFFVLT